MNRNKLMLVIAVVAAVVVVAGGVVLGVQPQLAQASANDAQANTVTHTNDSTKVELARLREQAKSLGTMQERLANLRRSVPDGASTADFYRELDQVAADADVTVSLVTVGDAAAYVAPVTAAAAAAGSAPTATASPSATASPTAAPTPTTPAAPTGVTDPSVTSENFSVIPVSVQVQGTFAKALAFVKGLQNGDRLFLVDSIATSVDASDNTGASAATLTSGASVASWTFAGSIYVLNTTTTSTAATSPAATPSATPSATPANG